MTVRLINGLVRKDVEKVIFRLGYVELTFVNGDYETYEIDEVDVIES